MTGSIPRHLNLRNSRNKFGPDTENTHRLAIMVFVPNSITHLLSTADGGDSGGEGGSGRGAHMSLCM